MWWAFAGANAGLAASTAMACGHLSAGSLRHRNFVNLAAIALTFTAAPWGFLALEAAR